MTNDFMNLKILLPSEVLASLQGIRRVVAETSEGALGLLPHRLDCTAILVPGILTFQTDGAETYAALDTGVLVKAGRDVLICVRNGLLGSDLLRLHDEVKNRFLHLDDQERQMRTALARVERGFVRRFWEVRHGT
jgi:F-type H+-transporting ATPase subunit epsilon